MQASRLTAIAGWLASVAAALGGGEAARRSRPIVVGPVPELRVRVVRGLARRLVGEQQLEDHLRAPTRRARESVFTFMPAVGLRMQEAASTRSPSISTMQARQLPSAR